MRACCKKIKVHKKNSGVGCKVTDVNKTIYHTGDTSLIPEMNEPGNIDLAFLPIDSTLTMNIDEAAQAETLPFPV